MSTDDAAIGINWPKGTGPAGEKGWVGSREPVVSGEVAVDVEAGHGGGLFLKGYVLSQVCQKDTAEALCSLAKESWTPGQIRLRSDRTLCL